MARATGDVQQIGSMVNPNFGLLFLALVYVVVALVSIASLHIALLLTPLIFGLIFPVLLQRFSRRLSPVVAETRKQFGIMNAGVVETLNGIEIIKGFGREAVEEQRFDTNARHYHNVEINRGALQANYLPLLFLAIFYALGFAHALFLWQQNVLSIGQVVAFMGLFDLLRFPTSLSLMSFTMIQLGLAGARRIYELITTETELDENVRGVSKPLEGAIAFEQVSFGYGDQPVLTDISFQARPGTIIALVGQTGSGKSTLTKLLNRTYDVTAGRVLIDGSDVREWSLESLRSQISVIEQDIFLFSRSIADNIAFGAGGQVSQDQIEAAARQAQAHEFIMQMPDGYQSIIGQRGVTLSGGQRQRIAIARAFLIDPRILLLDDSTSAIDSATEDQIQQAMQHIFQGRTTFLITHRLSQICLADWILFLHRGRLVDQGTHQDLLARNTTYRSLFMPSKRDIDLTPVIESGGWLGTP
jgi:ATP-binding cassette subfamily B protein